jgi:hypothetical protein
MIMERIINDFRTGGDDGKKVFVLLQTVRHVNACRTAMTP